MFWNEELGYATSLSTNFDWYSPVNAKRFSLQKLFPMLSLHASKKFIFTKSLLAFPVALLNLKSDFLVF